ncbi:hypothetical protein KFK09_023618 [Dendrobium nobile]|uniref:Uncharacterized protein n=1 Tax=Dendrobium nobile TaxID=94219 RepID=A0A8T3ABG2_DENNO|nr:hypothetical protein KFK09_023618 [Dendrobium nobile]
MTFPALGREEAGPILEVVQTTRRTAGWLEILMPETDLRFVFAAPRDSKGFLSRRLIDRGSSFSLALSHSFV